MTRLNCFQEIESAVAGTFTKNRGIVLAVLSCIGFILIVNSSWKATPDSALYLELGESLARGGGYVFNGEMHTYVPPGYPALVAVVARVFGESFLHYRILMALLGALTALAGYLLVFRLTGPDTAFLAGGLFALNHTLLHNASCTSSDVPFALVSLVGLHAVISAAGSRRRLFWTLCSGVLVGLPALVRVNGWGVPPAAAVFLFCQWYDRRYAVRLLYVAAFLLVAFVPGLLWEQYKATFPSSMQEGTYLNAITGRYWGAQAMIMLQSAWEYIPVTSEALSGLTIKTGVLELIVPCLVLVGMVGAFLNGERLLVPLTAIQFAGLFLSPAGSRYIILLLPGLYLFLLLGILRSGKWIAAKRGADGSRTSWIRKALVGVFVAFALFNMGHNSITISKARSALERGGAESERDLPFFAAGRWLRDHGADGVVLSMHPRVVHYLSGLPTIELVRSGVPEHLVWVDARDQIAKLIRHRKPSYIFSDAKNTMLYDQVLDAIDSLGLKVQDIKEVRTSPRFGLWKIHY